MNRKKIYLFTSVILVIILFYFLELGQFLSLDYFNSRKNSLFIVTRENPVTSGLIYFLTYIFITGISLPGAAVLTLIGGALFGLLWGTIIVSFASTIGATAAFMISRFVLRETIQHKFSGHLKTINNGMEKDGAYYLFTLRLVPLFPFFIINLLMGLTSIRLMTFFFVSQLGMLPGTIIYVNAGTQLAQVNNPGDILSPGLIFAFVLLGLFPLLTRWSVNAIQRRKIYKPYSKPEKFDRNLVVIGAGSAGLVSAYIATTVKARVTLVEKHKMGGDCLNTGCVPSKALIRSARFLSNVKCANKFGIKHASAEFDFADIMQRVQRIVKTVEPHDSIERYTRLGVECIEGQATLTSPWSVRINDRDLTSRAIIIATGAGPLVPPVPGLEQVDYLTSDNIWSLKHRPERLIVLGGGPIGSELSQCFARFGSQVTQVEMLPRLLAREDPEISEAIRIKFETEGINVLTGHTAKAVETGNGSKVLVCEHEKGETRIPFDAILVAVGRSPATTGFGLEDLGISLTSRGTIKVNDYMQTNYPNIFACGDVAGPFQFTHVAAHQAWYATVNALFGRFKKFRIDYSVIPWATFTDPEVARVGLNEQEAMEKNIPYEVTTYGIDDLDRAITDEVADGLVKVLTVPGKDRILGVTIMGEHAGDLITEYISAMRNNIGLNRILGTIHIYPTLAEANKYAAGNWKRNHVPTKLLAFSERYLNWLRH